MTTIAIECEIDFGHLLGFPANVYQVAEVSQFVSQ